MTGFSRKRGRPSKNTIEQDRGTLELRKKRSLGITTEPLDLCLKKRLITTNQHTSGIRLRWLYTIRFGSPDVSAYNFEGHGIPCKKEADEEWVKARYKDYSNALEALEKIGAKTIIMNICVFNQRASFLLPYPADISRHDSKMRNQKLLKFREGLEILENII